jgi:deferrochelatase/peroxidase EfeB
MTLSRRQLAGLAGAGAAAAGAVAGSVAQAASAGPVQISGLIGSGLTGSGLAGTADGPSRPVAFEGRHQAGIVTPAQDHLHFASFDVTTTDRARLATLLAAWTEAARALTAGAEAGPGGAFSVAGEAPPDDTGEAAGLPASGLTLTIGFGPTLFEHPSDGDRFGLAASRPSRLVGLPKFSGDDLDPSRVGGDLCVQACANDPMVASHAIRNLARIGFGTVAMRWSQVGFGRTSSTSRAQDTPRNLFGQKDGTNNLRAEDSDMLDQHVWVGQDDSRPGRSGWMTGGTYLVARRIRMHIETWDRTPLGEQETIIGRHKGSGAPLGGRHEFDQPNLAALGTDGAPVIASTAHVRLAHPTSNADTRLLRRGYNFMDGNDSLGRLDAGLFFLSFQRDPQQFVQVQRQLSRQDALNEYIEHTGSGVWACPPGLTGRTATWADHLFA